MTEKQSSSFSFSSRMKSFRDAGRGLVSLVATEPNARIHLCVAILVVVLGFALGIGASDWRWVVFLIAWVWSKKTALNRLFTPQT